MSNNDEFQTIIGQLAIFDGLEGQQLTVTTAEGENEYLITAKKWIKRLNKYADENIDIVFEGTVEYSPEEGMDVLTIKSFKPAEEVEDDLPTILSINEDMKFPKGKPSKMELLQDDDDEPLDEDSLDSLPWDNDTPDSENNDDNGIDDDAEPNSDELEDEDIPDDIDLDELEQEEEPPAPPAPPVKGKKNKR